MTRPSGFLLTKKTLSGDGRKKYFKGTPPAVGAIALMTDTDNTLSTAETSYKNIRVGYKNEDKK